MERLGFSEEAAKVSLIYQILAVTEMSRISELEDLVYQYGSTLRESDFLGRQIFIWMTSAIRSVKK